MQAGRLHHNRIMYTSQSGEVLRKQNCAIMYPGLPMPGISVIIKHMSLAQKILDSKKPFVFFHTWTVTKNLLRQAIDEGKSMDLDVCVDDQGKPYLGHSKEYHKKSGEPMFNTMPLWEAIDMIAKSEIPVMVDCKHYDAWPVVEKVVTTIGPERCLVDSFATELRFNYSRDEGEPDFVTEWSPIEKLRSFKNKFPSVTTAACAKWLPRNLLLSDQLKGLRDKIRQLLQDNHVDTVCLGVPDATMSDVWLRYFLDGNVIPQIGIDKIDTTKLTEVYIGETDDLKMASRYAALRS